MRRGQSWSDAARETIARVHASLPDDVSFKARKAAVDAAYPFGARDFWPYKAWCKARRSYLEGYGLKPVRSRLGQIELFKRDPVTGRPVIP